MQIGAIQSAAAPETPEKSYARKAVKAAQQFEAVLLNDLLGHLQKTFVSLPGKDSDSKTENYDFMSTQALATGLASAGGIGIARMISHKLLQNK